MASRPTTPTHDTLSSVPSPTDPDHIRKGYGMGSRNSSYLAAGTPGPSGLGPSQGAPVDSSPLSQSVVHHDGLGANDRDSVLRESEVGDPAELRRSDSQMSQSQAPPPSRGGTLKKKASLKRGTGSLKRTPSRRSSRAGSVRSLDLGEKEKHGTANEEMNSAFWSPVPTAGNPTEILATRFQSWRKLLKDLITYFRDIQKSYESKAKAVLQISNVINNTVIPSNFLTTGGIGDANTILREYHKQSVTESNKAKDMESEVIAQLTGLRSDLQQKIKEIKNLSGDFKNSVDRETETTKRNVRSLQEAIGGVDHDAGTTTGRGDPFLVKMTVDRQLERQIEEENYLHRAYLNLESSGRELESIVVGEIQKAYNALASILKREADEGYEVVEKLRDGPTAMSKDHEWESFITGNTYLVDPKIPVRQFKHITYPGKDHPAATEIRSGMLERKSKYLKSYTPGWYVLSPTHLHEFKSADRIASQAPVMSLYLPDQKLGSHSEGGSSSHKFMLKGRQTGSMHRGHAWVFRAETHDTMMAWFSDIRDLTETTGEARNAFVRRAHARSVSGTSQKAPSILSSEGGMEEDEADAMAFSAVQSVRDPDQGDHEDEEFQRPQPGGRFPSDIQVNRELQAPMSPSSGESSGERDVLASAGALPGSDVPFTQPDHPVPSEDATNHPETSHDLAAATAPLASPVHADNATNHAGTSHDFAASTAPLANAVATDNATDHAGTNHELATSVAPGASQLDTDSAANHAPGHPDHPGESHEFRWSTPATTQPPPAPADHTFTGYHGLGLQQNGSKYGDWMAPIAGAGVGGAAIGAVAMHHHNKEQQQQEQEHDDLQAQTQSQGPSQIAPAQPTAYEPYQPGLPSAAQVDPADAPMVVSAAETATDSPAVINQSTHRPISGSEPSQGDSLSTVPTSTGSMGGADPIAMHVAVAAAAAASATPMGLDMGLPQHSGNGELDSALKRPNLKTNQSTITISDLHVPGEFPRSPPAY